MSHPNAPDTVLEGEVLQGRGYPSHSVRFRMARATDARKQNHGNVLAPEVAGLLCPEQMVTFAKCIHEGWSEGVIKEVSRDDEEVTFPFVREVHHAAQGSETLCDELIPELRRIATPGELEADMEVGRVEDSNAHGSTSVDQCQRVRGMTVLRVTQNAPKILAIIVASR